MTDAFDKYMFSKEFGWTPEYIDKMCPVERMTYRCILVGSSEGQAEAVEKAKKA